MNTTLQIVFKSVAVAKLVNAARQPTEIVLRQSSAEECAPTSVLSISCRSVRELIDDADDSMFSQLTNNENQHVLHQLLPARRNTGHDLRPQQHDRLLTQTPNSIVESADFIIRMLRRDSY